MADLKSFFSRLLQQRHDENLDASSSPVTQPTSAPISTASPMTRPRMVTAPGTPASPAPGDDFDPRQFLDTISARPNMPDVPTYTPHEKHGALERVIGFFRGGREGGLGGAIEGAARPEKQEFRDWYQTKYAPAMQQRQALSKEADDQTERKIKAVQALGQMTTALSNKKKIEADVNKPTTVTNGTELGYIDKATNKFVPFTDSEGKPLTHSSVATAQINSTARMSEQGLRSQTEMILQKQKDILEHYKQQQETARANARNDAEYKRAMDSIDANFRKEIGMAVFNAGATAPDEKMFTPSEEEIYNYQQANKVDRANAIEGATREKKERYYRTNKPKDPVQGKNFLEKIFGPTFK